MENIELLRFPIGHFVCPKEISKAHIADWITEMETLPERLEQLVKDFDESQLETPYRPEGWTVRQVIHHIADSHHNSYIRFKWALTEDNPLIKVYDEKHWSNLFDARMAPITLSLTYLKALHAKLVYLLKGLTEKDLEKSFIHPDGNERVTLAENIGKYAWHGNHHLQHIAGLARRKGWV